MLKYWVEIVSLPAPKFIKKIFSRGTRNDDDEKVHCIVTTRHNQFSRDRPSPINTINISVPAESVISNSEYKYNHLSTNKPDRSIRLLRVFRHNAVLGSYDETADRCNSTDKSSKKRTVTSIFFSYAVTDTQSHT